MATFLLTVIYIAFIGLGIPDSIFGTAWPVIYREFGVSVSWASYYSMLCFAGTVSSSLLSARLLNRFGTARVTAFSTLLTACALILTSLCESIWPIMLLAIPLGLGAGAIDTGLNNYVALHYSASQMSFLHCFYGVGVAASPYILSLFLGGEGSWRGGYRIAFIIQLSIAALCFLSFPLWKKVGKAATAEGDAAPPRTVSFRELMKMPAVRSVCLVFFASVLLEFVCGTWCATFLVDHKGLSPDLAAGLLVIYYLGMISGRFLSGILSPRMSGWRIIKLGILFIGAGLVLIALPLGSRLSAIALFCVALGNGPVYPILSHLAPVSFGKDISRSVMGVQYAAANTGAMLGPPLFGLIAGRLGVGLLPWYLAAALVIMCIGLIASLRNLTR